MTRRIARLSTALLLLFIMLLAQSVNIQWFRAASLSASPYNPRIATSSTQFPRGEIVAADGTILARSVASHDPVNPFRREYPLGTLTSGVVGFAGPTYGTRALEYEYNSYLTPHAQPAQSMAQVLAPTSAADNITLTLEPTLQRIARKAMGNQIGAAVVLDPRSGAVLSMYSNPTYDPTPYTSPDIAVARAAWKRDTTPNAHGFEPLGLVALQQTFPPGSTFKVITTAAAVVHQPKLLTKKYPYEASTALPYSNKRLFNDGGQPCGGDVAQMLPPSCDPGYALLGLDLGAPTLFTSASSFGYNEVPPIDLPGGETSASYFPPPKDFLHALPTLAYSAIGQDNVRATTLQQALLAAAIANGGVEMTPHLLKSVTGPLGQSVLQFQNRVWKRPMTAKQDAQIVPLMVNVVRYGTAAGLFLPQDQVAAKTGTAQTLFHGVHLTDDWMIAFAPANHPTVAVAVAMPFQAVTNYGATVAGPIVKCLIEGTLALQAGQPATGTSTTCPS